MVPLYFSMQTPHVSEDAIVLNTLLFKGNEVQFFCFYKKMLIFHFNKEALETGSTTLIS
jgi:hypothetical protein